MKKRDSEVCFLLAGWSTLLVLHCHMTSWTVVILTHLNCLFAPPVKPTKQSTTTESSWSALLKNLLLVRLFLISHSWTVMKFCFVGGDYKNLAEEECHISNSGCSKCTLFFIKMLRAGQVSWDNSDRVLSSVTTKIWPLPCSLQIIPHIPGIREHTVHSITFWPEQTSSF